MLLTLTVIDRHRLVGQAGFLQGKRDLRGVRCGGGSRSGSRVTLLGMDVSKKQNERMDVSLRGKRPSR
jgi:hypothetical protein